MIAGSDYVGPSLDHLVNGLRSEAKTTGKVFTLEHNKVETQVVPLLWQDLLHSSPATRPNHITNHQYPHIAFRN